MTWPAFAILVVVALIGFSMFFRWLPQVRDRQRVGGAACGNNATPEQKLPAPVVVAHGLAGATTLVLVLVAAVKA